ncbi:CD48 antigen [Notolabrus celidotus]|uniref:CD48 antigen n=1 Tax=Notolabrus celidotus TaxID=1203425 RepID=UPI00149029D1|nr:CD48 antigen [Notolabrus celidotus]
MAGGRLRCPSCIFKCSAALFFWVCFYDVEAHSCQDVIHKKVGDTVELSSCLPPEDVIAAIWRFKYSQIAKKNANVDEGQFKGRLELHRSNWSLTVKDLTVQDSGEYSFVSEVENSSSQRPTVRITLQVYESITEPPVVIGNSTWNSSTNSCTVFLQCSSNSGGVSYKWTVGDQTTHGSTLEHNTREQDGDTKFTCTIYNYVNKMSKSEIVKCSRDQQEISPDKRLENLFFILGIVVGPILLIVVIVIAVVVYCCKKSKAAGGDSNEQTIYADITEVAIEQGSPSTMKPCSVYETIDDRNNQVTPGAQTVYDKIQLNRMRALSVSPYQEIS